MGVFGPPMIFSNAYTYKIKHWQVRSFWLANYSWTPLIRSPKGKGKWFELTGARINEVKTSSKALQGKWILLRISGDFELSEFELSVFNCTFHNNNQVLIEKCCYGNSRFAACLPFWPPSWIFQKFYFAANFLETLVCITIFHKL